MFQYLIVYAKNLIHCMNIGLEIMKEIKVPPLGESVTEATVSQWLKKPGDQVKIDEPVVELETDKITLEVVAQESGFLKAINAPQGAKVAVGAVLGLIGAEEQATAHENASAAHNSTLDSTLGHTLDHASGHPSASNTILSPAARKLSQDNHLNPAEISSSGKDGRVTKGDVLHHLSHRPENSSSAPNPSSSEQPAMPVSKSETFIHDVIAPKASPSAPPAGRIAPQQAQDKAAHTGEQQERVRMSALRRKIAERLKHAQNTAAILTTFNEIDMTNVMNLRQKIQDEFTKKHGVKLGFMSFFVKAVLSALKEFPAVNAEIDGDDIVYKNYYHIGVAVGTEQGLVVPVVRNADKLSFAKIESIIADYGKKARDGKLSVSDLTGGTFTISNGGTYGSLMSTPILNPPQSGILGMHKIQPRPVVVQDKIEIRSMMYVALSYDHRIIDGKEAVSFLVRVKEIVEDPQKLIFDM